MISLSIYLLIIILSISWPNHQPGFCTKLGLI